MPKPASIGTSVRPMPPKPTIPSVRSRSSLPMRPERSCQRPSRTSRSFATTWCESASIQATVASAMEWFTAPAVIIASTFASVHAATSTLS